MTQQDDDVVFFTAPKYVNSSARRPPEVYWSISFPPFPSSSLARLFSLTRCPVIKFSLRLSLPYLRLQDEGGRHWKEGKRVTEGNFYVELQVKMCGWRVDTVSCYHGCALALVGCVGGVEERAGEGGSAHYHLLFVCLCRCAVQEVCKARVLGDRNYSDAKLSGRMNLMCVGGGKEGGGWGDASCWWGQ